MAIERIALAYAVLSKTAIITTRVLAVTFLPYIQISGAIASDSHLNMCEAAYFYLKLTLTVCLLVKLILQVQIVSLLCCTHSAAHTQSAEERRQSSAAVNDSKTH